MTTSISNSNIYNNNITISSKVCTNCNQNKPLTEYHKDKTTSDGFRYVCKSCRLIVSKYYRKIINKLMLIKFILKMILKSALNAGNENYILSFIKMQQRS